MASEIKQVHEGGPKVLVEDGYQFWHSPGLLDAPWRWAHIQWADDGFGIPGHGGALTLDGARGDAHRNRAQREAVST